MSLYYSDDHVTLYHGDSLVECQEWLNSDVLVTDPPYGMSYESNRVSGRRSRAIRGDRDTETRDDALSSWGDGPALVFGTWKTLRPYGTRNVLIWDKGADLGTGDLNMPWGYSHEDIYVLGKWPKLTPGGRAREGGTPSRVPSVVRVPKPNNASSTNVNHPTPKPVPLMEALISRCPAGSVADPFAGSGSTLIAARNLGRKAVGVEIDEAYCELIANRLSQGVLNFGEAA